MKDKRARKIHLGGKSHSKAEKHLLGFIEDNIKKKNNELGKMHDDFSKKLDYLDPFNVKRSIDQMTPSRELRPKEKKSQDFKAKNQFLNRKANMDSKREKKDKLLKLSENITNSEITGQQFLRSQKETKARYNSSLESKVLIKKKIILTSKVFSFIRIKKNIFLKLVLN